MSSSHFTSSIYLLTFALLLQTIFGAIFSKCSVDKFVDNDLYDKNLEEVFRTLTLPDHYTTFSTCSIGMENNFKAFGSYLCRGDLNATDCAPCVFGAIKEVKEICPYKLDAFVWNDYCFLKYSILDFYGGIDNNNRFYMSSGINASQPQIFNQKARELLTGLAKKAAVPTNFYYAAGEILLQGSKKIYGYVQCTLDLDPSDCLLCLDNAINDAVKGTEGGRIAGGSCNVRYDVSPFLNS